MTLRLFVKPERIEVPVLGKDVLDRLNASVGALGNIATTLTVEGRSLSKTLADVAAALAKVGRNGHGTNVTAPGGGVRTRLDVTAWKPPPAPDKPKPGERGEFGRGERVVLTAIAQHKNGVTKEQLTVLTGYKRSTRDLYVQKLAAGGFVVREGSRIHATTRGIAHLGDFERLPTGDELREHWLSRLPTGERAVLEAVLAKYPEAVRREDLEVEYQRSTRDLYLQKLAARELVESPGPGLVRASEELFG